MELFSRHSGEYSSGKSAITKLRPETLNSGKVTDAAIEVLSGLKNLRKLNIAGTKITAVGREKIGKAVPRVQIKP